MDSLVERKARAAFADRASAALRLLEEYQGPETTRVQLALLKLSGSDFGQLELQVSVAGQDYRDAIRFAESPRIATLWPSTLAAMSEEEKAALATEDSAEYAAWLEL